MLGCKVSLEIDIFGNEYDYRRWNRGREYVSPAKCYRKRFERFRFAMFHYILFYRREDPIDSTKRGKLNVRVIYN